MFTGIIQEVGTVLRFEQSGGVHRLYVRATGVSARVRTGDSVSVNGVCLTAVSAAKGAVGFDVMGETVRKTSLSRIAVGGRVNIEDALRIGDHLGGHIVQGHVDCVGTVERITKGPGELSLEIGIPSLDAHLVVEKGSVALDGISLTVGAVTAKSFTVYLIPHTLAITNLGDRKTGDAVNVEYDIIGKYIARSKELQKEGSGVSEELLRRAKFI